MLSVENIVIPPPQEGQTVDPMAWYESPGPFEVEIGTGKGGFLLARAQTRLDVRLLGIEWANKYCLYAADRMARWGLCNVRMMRTDAATLFRHHLPAECIQTVHLYHPDPWPKKRHHKRRLVQSEFVTALARCLVPGGLWRIQTDHHEYFEWILEVVHRFPAFEVVDWQATGLVDGSFAGTNYEAKYTRENKPIYRVAYRRCVQAPAS